MKQTASRTPRGLAKRPSDLGSLPAAGQKDDEEPFELVVIVARRLAGVETAAAISF